MHSKFHKDTNFNHQLTTSNTLFSVAHITHSSNIQMFKALSSFVHTITQGHGCNMDLMMRVVIRLQITKANVYRCEFQLCITIFYILKWIVKSQLHVIKQMLSRFTSSMLAHLVTSSISIHWVCGMKLVLEGWLEGGG